MQSYIFYIELIGIIAFAISGALEGIKNRMDFLGVIILGIVTATGGGVIRDLILGINPPLSFRTGLNIYLSIITSVVVFLTALFNDKVNKRTVHKIFEDALVYTDAVGLGVFTVTGMQIAYSVSYEYSAILYIFVGLISGVGGGVIRDLLTDTVPYIMDRHVYASASIAGGFVFHQLQKQTFIHDAVLIPLCIIIVVIIRIYTYKKKLNLPKATKIMD